MTGGKAVGGKRYSGASVGGKGKEQRPRTTDSHLNRSLPVR